MTMAEIDQLRLSEAEVQQLRPLLAANVSALSDDEWATRRALEARRRRVEEALRIWWGQRCREVAC